MLAVTDTKAVHVTGRWVAVVLMGVIGGLILIQCGLLTLVHLFDKPTVFASSMPSTSAAKETSRRSSPRC